jgi:hypothetical protein
MRTSTGESVQMISDPDDVKMERTQETETVTYKTITHNTITYKTIMYKTIMYKTIMYKTIMYKPATRGLWKLYKII